MPVQRVSKPFKDISASFKSNPLNSDLIGLKNANAIARSIRNLILTEPGEKPFQPRFGSVVTRSLFDLSTNLNEVRITDEIKTALSLYEPRIGNLEVRVRVMPDTNEMNTTITYSIIGIPAPAQKVDVLLFPARV